jgi:transcriptional regulator with XRE-family HTH domain
MTTDIDAKVGGPASPPSIGADRRTHEQLEKLPPDARAKAESAIAQARTPEHRAEQERIRREYQALDRDPLAAGDYQVWGAHGDRLHFLKFLGRLKRERERLKLSLDEMARRTGMDRMAVSRLENGKNPNPTVSTLVRYANALGRSITWGLEGEGDGPKGETPAESQPLSIPAFDPSVRVVMEHAGGPLDGYAPTSDSPDPQEAQWVRTWYMVHDRGAIGKAFMGNSLENFKFLMEQARKNGFTGGLQAHKYQIVDRREEGNTVIVRYEYKGLAE